MKTLFRKTYLAATASLICLLAGTTVNAQSDPTASTSSFDSVYVVSLPHIMVDDMHLYDTLDIMLNSGNVQLAGFELKFGAPGRLFDIVEVLPGELCDSCNWEMFNAKRIDTQSKTGFPSIMYKVVAIAKVLPDSTRKSCFGLGRPVSLARLVVTNEYAHETPDTTLPLYFIWEDCTDNTISGIDGNTLFLSYRTVDLVPNSFDTTGNPFPSVRGAPRNCIKPGGPNVPKRAIEFRNGGIEFKLNLMKGDSGQKVEGTD